MGWGRKLGFSLGSDEKSVSLFFEKDKSTFLLVVDVYSERLDVIPMTSTTSLKTVVVLRSLFPRYGLPEGVQTMGLS